MIWQVNRWPASTSVERMVTWSEKLGAPPGGGPRGSNRRRFVHDIGVDIDSKTHYTACQTWAREILPSAGLPAEKIDTALELMGSHSRYGGSELSSLEAKVGRDADALEYIGAIGKVRAIVRSMADGSYTGKARDFPVSLENLLGKREGSFRTDEAEDMGAERISYMRSFLERIEQELRFGDSRCHKYPRPQGGSAADVRI